MFEIEKERTFSASHQLREFNGRCERLHGHNFRVRVCLAAAELDSNGTVMDFNELDELMQCAVAPLDHQHLNDLDAFKIRNPSAENIAAVIAEAVEAALEGKTARLKYCDVFETDRSRARYIPDNTSR
jgi:6-pyruvoyltetrahydropterin/6-carboxytetrahydropterin synthase